MGRSRRFTLRIREELWGPLEEVAKKEDCSIAWIVNRAIMKELNIFELPNSPMKTFTARKNNPGKWFRRRSDYNG